MRVLHRTVERVYNRPINIHSPIEGSIGVTKVPCTENIIEAVGVLGS